MDDLPFTIMVRLTARRLCSFSSIYESDSYDFSGIMQNHLNGVSSDVAKMEPRPRGEINEWNKSCTVEKVNIFFN